MCAILTGWRSPSNIGDQKLIQIVDCRARRRDSQKRRIGSSAARDARNAASELSPSINSMPLACAEGLPILRSRSRSARHGCVSALASRLPACRRTFPAIPSAASWTKEKRPSNASPTSPTTSLVPRSIRDTGHCELYESRPMTCRVFGPPVRSEDGLGVCELCFHGATRGRDRRLRNES